MAGGVRAPTCAALRAACATPKLMQPLSLDAATEPPARPNVIVAAATLEVLDKCEPRWGQGRELGALS